MKYEYDEEADGLFIWFVDIEKEKEKENYGGEIWPEELKGDIGVLFDKNGRLFGLEVIFASKYFPQEKLDKIGANSYKE